MLKIINGSVLFFLIIGGLFLWSVIFPPSIRREYSKYDLIQKGEFHRNKKEGVVLEYNTNKPVIGVLVKYFYQAHSKKNSTPLFSGLDHRSSTRICYATYYTKTNIKGEFTIPPLPEKIKLQSTDDSNRVMLSNSSITLYHPNYIFMSGPWPRNVYFSFPMNPNSKETIIRPYPNNMDPETRYMYLGAKKGSLCGELLSSPNSFNKALQSEIKKLEEIGIKYNAMKMKWNGPENMKIQPKIN